MTGNERPWRVVDDGVTIRIRLTPRAAHDEIGGAAGSSDGTVITAKVRAVPEKGAANTALERLIAAWLGEARSLVSVEAGGKSRIKRVLVRGDGQRLQQRLEALTAALPSGDA